MKIIERILKFFGLRFIKREAAATLTEDLVREIVAFHRSLPAHLSASIMVHPKSAEEYSAVVSLAGELDMEGEEDGVFKTGGPVENFPVYFFKPWGGERA